MSPARTVRCIVAVLVFFPALSCGGTPPAPQAPALQASLSAEPVPVPDLRAVPDPPSLVVSGRLAKPSASMSIVHEWTKLPMPQSEEVAELVMGEAVGPLVDLDLPIDFAVAVVGTGAGMRNRTAVSVALKNADRAKATLADRYKLVPGDNGTLLVHGLGSSARHSGGEERSEDDRRVCEFAPAYGASPVRLVCGRSAEALAELAPWLTRTLTRAPADDDVRIDVRMRALRATLSKDRRLLAMLLSSELGERIGWAGGTVSSFARELVDFALDLETLSLVVTMSEPAASGWLGFKLAGQASSIAQLMTMDPSAGLSTPAAFWQLPGDADLAYFEPGLDDLRLAQWRDFVLRIVGDELAVVGVPGVDRTAIAAAVSRLVPSAAMSYASGLDPEAVRKALTAAAPAGDSTSSDRAELKRQSLEALFGWHLVELDQPAAQWIGALKDLAGAWGRSGVVEGYRMGSKDWTPPSLHAAPLPHGVVLPSGAQHYVVALPSFAPSLAAGQGSGRVATKASGPVRPPALHLFVVPDGARTWIALGGTDAIVASKLAVAIGGAGEKLAARAELASLKTPVALGGFVTLQGLVGGSQQAAFLSGGSMPAAAQAFGELASLPYHGTVPMPISWGAYPGKAGPPTAGAAAPLGVSIVLPRAAIEDAVTEILRHSGIP